MSYWLDKVALVTGASSGLGRAIAEALVRAGAKVVMVARSVEPLEELAATLRKAGGDVVSVAMDVTVEGDVASLAERVRSHYGRLDLLVNNAGRSMRGDVVQTTLADFRQMMELNLLSVVHLTQTLLPLLQTARGHVVNIGSLAGKAASRYLGAYPASKFALSAYTQQLRLELEPQGLHVLLVCPGPLARHRPRRSESPESTAAAADLPASAQRPGGGVRTKAIDPERLAADILWACQKRRRELVRPRKARLLFALQQLSPSLGDFLIRRMTAE